MSETIYVDGNGKILKSAEEATSGAVQLNGEDAEEFLKTGKSRHLHISPDVKKADEPVMDPADRVEAYKAKAAPVAANKARRASSNK